MIMVCNTSVVSSSPYLFETVSYTLQKFQIWHIYVADVAHISKGTTPLVYESNISRTRRVRMATNRSGKSICYQTCLSSWILSVIVCLLDTVVSSKHLTRILEVVILRHLRNNWFKSKHMHTTLYTRHSSSPLLQIGMPGYEATNGGDGIVNCYDSSTDTTDSSASGPFKFFESSPPNIVTTKIFPAIYEV